MKNEELSDIRTVIEILNKEANIVRLSIINKNDVLESLLLDKSWYYHNF